MADMTYPQTLYPCTIIVLKKNAREDGDKKPQWMTQDTIENVFVHLTGYTLHGYLQYDPAKSGIVVIDAAGKRQKQEGADLTGHIIQIPTVECDDNGQPTRGKIGGYILIPGKTKSYHVMGGGILWDETVHGPIEVVARQKPAEPAMPIHAPELIGV